MSSLDSAIQHLSQAKAVLRNPISVNPDSAIAIQDGYAQAMAAWQASGGTIAEAEAIINQGGGGDGGSNNVSFNSGGSSGTASEFEHGLEYGGEGTEAVYTGERLQEIVAEDVPGSGDSRLNDLMEDMQSLDPNDRPAVEAMMTEIADIRGTDPQDMVDDFDKMTEIMQDNGLSFDTINENLHPDFMGSDAHLTYGNVVGTSIGMDPVFGAMMNPSGGLTGPGNMSLPTDPNSAITKHGIVHDAAGFMLNALGIGYGYDYVGEMPDAPWYLNDFLPSTHPLAGQWNGVAYWESVNHGNFVSSGIGAVGDFVDLGTEFIDLGLQAGGEWLSDNVPIVGGLLGWGVNGIGNVVGGVGDVFDSGTEIAADFVDSTWDAASDAWDGATDWASDTWDSATDWASDTWDSATDWAGDTWDSATDWAGDTWDSLTGGGNDSGGGGSSGNDDGGCFLTTSACEHRGLADDCHELTVLRGFRDSWMHATPELQEQVREYYRIAPAVVNAIQMMPDGSSTLERMFVEYIRPSVEAIERGENDKAYTIYVKMLRNVQELTATYL